MASLATLPPSSRLGVRGANAPTRVLLSLLLLTPTEVVYTGRLADALLGFFRLPPALVPAAPQQLGALEGAGTLTLTLP